MAHFIAASAGSACLLPLLAALACGPGPLPAENPPLALSTPLEPLPVQVESTVQRVTKKAGPQTPPPVSERSVPSSSGFKTPESVIYDDGSDVYLVANVNGSPTALDDNGFISQVNPDGSLRNLMFISGTENAVTLNAPKGMALEAGVLYVTDINTVRKFDAKSGTALGTTELPRATFANDITFAPEGAAFVSDSGLEFRDGQLLPTGTDAIYRLDGERVSVVASGKHLEQPNGLLYMDGTLWCASFSSNKLRQLSLQGEVLTTIAMPGGALDGIVTLPDGQMVVSSWEAQSLFVGSPSKGFGLLRKHLAAPADIGFDAGRNRLLIPLFLNDELRFVDNSYSKASSTGRPVALAPQL